MLKYGIVEPSSSPWASNWVVVKKKNSDIRLCIDWQQLNTATIKDAYPFPNLPQDLDVLACNKWFSTIDSRQGFNQVEIEESDRYKTVFYSRKFVEIYISVLVVLSWIHLFHRLTSIILRFSVYSRTFPFSFRTPVSVRPTHLAYLWPSSRP